MRIVKVGGSLYDWPELGAALRRWLDDSQTLLVPGGGALTEVIRGYDGVHRLGEEASHWLALGTLAVNARLLMRLVEARLLDDFEAPLPPGVSVVDVERFCRWDRGSLPVSWEVTSDSLAVRVAAVMGASELVLLKSVDMPAGMSWEEASRRGIVDRYFCRALAENARGLSVRLLNLRSGYEWSGPCER